MDSNPLRNRSRHSFGALIAIPRNPQAIIRRVAQINQRFAVTDSLSGDLVFINRHVSTYGVDILASTTGAVSDTDG